MREHFVCVRITQMNGVNLRRFHFDYDTTWNAFFLDEKLNVYSRYGGRDESSPEGRLKKESLLQTMREVLDVHARRADRNQADRIQDRLPNEKRPLVQPVPAGVDRPEDIPLLRQNHRGCVHCHQVREYQILQSFHDGKFDSSELFGWPLPENVGLKLDLTHGHRIERLLKGSPAEKAGLKSGDVLAYVGGVPIHSEYDVRWALDRAEDGKPLRVVVQRAGDAANESESAKQFETAKQIEVALKLPPGWRKTDIGWRRSLRSVPVQWGFRAYPLTRSQLTELNLPLDRLAIRVISVRPFGMSGNLGLEKRDLIVSVAGQTESRTFNGFKSDLLHLYRPGEEIRLTVLRDGQPKQLTGKFPAWHTEETVVP